MFKFNKLFLGISILLIVLFNSGCGGNPRAEAFQRLGLEEVDLNIYQSVANFKKDKNATLLASHAEGVGRGGNYQHEFNFTNLTQEQYEFALKKIDDSMKNDGKLINNEYSGLMYQLKEFDTLNKNLEKEKIKSNLLNNSK